MKKIAFILVMGVGTTTTFAQKIQKSAVPEAVKSSMQKQFPIAKEVKWDKEGSNFEASFDLNEKDQSVLFDPQGNIQETEMEIEKKELPIGILDYVKLHYKGKEAKEVARITDAQGSVTFEVEVGGKDVIFDSNGKFLKESKE